MFQLLPYAVSRNLPMSTGRGGRDLGLGCCCCHCCRAAPSLENDRGNPGVKILYPYPYPPIPLPLDKGRGFEGVGVRVLRGMGVRGYPQGFTKGYEIYCAHDTGTTFCTLISLSLTKFIELHAPTHISRAANCTIDSYGCMRHSMYMGILCTVTHTVCLCCRSSDGMVWATKWL
jgi:hypothetical protein